MTPEDIDKRFNYHRPDEIRAEAHADVRGACKKLAIVLDEILLEGREKSLAVTNLEQVMFWANASIARS